MTTETVDVRVERDLPEADYHAHPALSASGAKLLLPPSCPARYAYQREHPPPPRPVFDVGHAAHKLVLGVGADLVEVADEWGANPGEWRTKAVKERLAEVRAAGAVPLKPADYATVHAMAARLREHPIAGELLDPARMRPELSLFWADDQTGVPRRARVDAVSTPDVGGQAVVVDYKSAAAADLDHISRALWHYGYAIQAAWYLDAVQACGLTGPDARFLFVFQEKEPPHLVSVVEPDAMALAVGARLARQAIEIWRDCTASGVWPGHFPDGEIPLVGLPAYIERQHTMIDEEWM